MKEAKGTMTSVMAKAGAKATATPELRFPEFRGKGSWEVKRLEEVCEILNNRREPITSANREKGKYPYYGASGVIDFVNNFIFDERLVLVGEDGAKWSAFERSAFIVEGKCWVNNHAHVLKATAINEVLLENYLVMLNLEPFITGAAPPKLTLGRLKHISIPLPIDITEQQKIADCLISLDELISAEDEKLTALKDHKKGLLQKLFPAEGETTPKLRFPEFRGKEAWEVKRFGECCSITTGKLDANAMIENGQYRFYTCAKNYYFINCYAFDTEALLISGNGNVGYIHHYKGKFNAYQRTYILDKFDESILFVKYYLQHNLYKRIFIEKKDGNIPYIVKSALTDMEIMLPHKDEQQKIADCLTSLDELISAEGEKLVALKDHKKGLMQMLFPVQQGI